MNSAEEELTPGQREIARLAEDPKFREEALRAARHALWRHGLPETAAEDAYQSAILRLHKHFEKHETEGIKDLFGYSMMVVLNEARRFSEREKKRPQARQA